MIVRPKRNPQDHVAELWRRRLAGELTQTEFTVLANAALADFLDSIPRDERRAA